MKKISTIAILFAFAFFLLGSIPAEASRWRRNRDYYGQNTTYDSYEDDWSNRPSRSRRSDYYGSNTTYSSYDDQKYDRYTRNNRHSRPYRPHDDYSYGYGENNYYGYDGRQDQYSYENNLYQNKYYRSY